MSRKFNTAGPSVPGEHYSIDPLGRLDLPEIESLIADRRYFLLHAPRQTGKTTSLLALTQYLNQQGRFLACYANIEPARAAGADVAAGVREVAAAIARAAKLYLGDERLRGWMDDSCKAEGTQGALTGLLERWSKASDRPLVLILDELGTLAGDTQNAVLCQIRAGYAQRPAAFPQSVILCGVRDIGEYRAYTASQKILTEERAFRIDAGSRRRGHFSRAQTQALWCQHQSDTGQRIDPAIFPELWEDTHGHPWLVNALGHEMTWSNRELRDRTRAITAHDYDDGRYRLILARSTHLERLYDTLMEERVQRLMGAILSSGCYPRSRPDDLEYIEDLGLIVIHPQVRIANRIYNEVVPREMTWTLQVTLPIP